MITRESHVTRISAEYIAREPMWNRNVAETATAEEARKRLDAILSDRLLWFNPYRVSDRELLDCAERGRWRPFPSVTQMIVYHFHDIRPTVSSISAMPYDGIFYHLGDSKSESHFGVSSLLQTLTHRATRLPVWTLVNGRHLVPSNIHNLKGKDIFVSHALCCDYPRDGIHQAYRMHSLYGSESKRAATIRESMCVAKLEMLGEILRYAVLPEYLGNTCRTFDHSTPLLNAMASIRRFPAATSPTTHHICQYSRVSDPRVLTDARENR